MQTEQKFLLENYSLKNITGSVIWEAPSNIALVKYWGKKLNQIPANPSISFTLNTCKTITKVDYIYQENQQDYSFEFLFDGKPKEDFNPKIIQFFERILPYMPFLKKFHFVIDSKNTFPHSSGIASSASAMAALSLCLMSVERELTEINDDYFYQKASFLARLGSGSACRSIIGSLVAWGEHKEIIGSSDLFGVEASKDIDPIFSTFQDAILLVDVGQKQVSSTVGHGLMKNHPFAEQRFKQAPENISILKRAMTEGDLNTFIQIVESEALTLHSMMMTSTPYFILMKPNTLEIINKIWEFRSSTSIPVCFTLDAGANVHVLYPEKYKKEVNTFIKDTLSLYCHEGQYILDAIGGGAKKL